jgi:DNA end-binding protein Ku
MPRAIWTGSISFGLVTVPVRLVTAVRDRHIRFNMLTPDGTCRLRQKLYCPETNEEFDFKQAAKGYQIAPDQYVLIDEKEIDRLKPDKGRTIDIEAFVSLDEIDPVYYDRTYYLTPNEGGAKAYRLLVQAMSKAGRVGIAKFVLRDQQHLVALRPKDGVLILHTMFFDDEVVDPASLEVPEEQGGRGATRELDVAKQLIETLSGPFKPGDHHDEFREKLEHAIQEKAEGREIVTAASSEDDAPPVYSLMEALKESLAKTEQQRKKLRRSTGAAVRKRRKSA